MLRANRGSGAKTDAIHVHGVTGQHHAFAHIHRGVYVASAQTQVHGRGAAIKRGDIRIYIQGNRVIAAACSDGQTLDRAVNIAIQRQVTVTQ